MKEPEKIYDYSSNDSRVPVTYVIVNNEILGGGGFGEVFKVKREINGESPDNQFFAMKRIKKEGLINEKDKHYRILSEIKIQRTLKNKYICKYEHSFEDQQNIYIIMEFCERKSIDDYLKIRKSFTEYETRYYMFQVLLGLKYLRRKKVVHRDLTLPNIFLKDYKSVKIGDFGLSFIETENEEKPGLICGTKGYFTPESIQTRYSFKTDIFCLGVCIYHMMTGTTLFKDAVSSYEAIRKPDINYDEKTKFSKQCKDLFDQIFVLENKRIDLDDIFVHPFFNEGKGLIDADFPNFFDEKLSKKDFEEKIKNLEKNVIMTDVSTISRKKDDFSATKSNEFSGDNWDNSNEKNIKKDNNFLKDSIKNILLNNKKKAMDNIKNKLFPNNINLSKTTDDTIININKNTYNNDIKNEKLKENNNDKNNNNIDKKNEKDINENKNIFLNEIKEEEEEKKEDNDSLYNEKPLFILDELTRKRNKTQKMSRLIMPGITIGEKEKEDADNNADNKNKTNNDEHNDNINMKLNLSNNYFANSGTFNQGESSKFVQKLKGEDSKINFNKIYFAQNIHIKKIIQENDKVGIAYLLDNDDIGILFNDDTTMIKFNQYKNLVYYITSNNTLNKILLPLKSIEDKDIVDKIRYLGYIIEESIKKKLRMKLNEENSKNDNSFAKMINKNEIDYINKSYVYALKYKKNKYAQFFILSNNIIQIKYRDKTDIIFCYAKNKKIIYINNEGKPTEFELEPEKEFCDFNSNNPKINKKIKYAIKEITK